MSRSPNALNLLPCLDSDEIADARWIAEEVLSHLAGLPGANAEVTLEIQVEIPDGIHEYVVRTVMENCRTLSFKPHDFESS